ncbi:hypothetical protein NE237_027337 [Protea cynaroides]|uniref:Uncharacterized protein n=1 Tax=Protea cynaroides TaxID=273540 RepID=A0A9Q0GN84_9MAGN|nr:hypothetical protein NE237_027337 [Protea cynaroides]
MERTVKLQCGKLSWPLLDSCWFANLLIRYYSFEMAPAAKVVNLNVNGLETADPVADVVADMNLSNAKKPFKMFVGYDPREDVAYEVCRYSVLKRSSVPVEVIPIKQQDLISKGLYWRERGPTESTQFSFSRFLTPFLANFDGWALFVDCDFLYTADIKELIELIDDKYAIMCVQHDYTPKESTKMDGAVQTVYPRKNWSSMVLYNCGHPKNKILTPELVNTQTGAFLHRSMRMIRLHSPNLYIILREGLGLKPGRTGPRRLNRTARIAAGCEDDRAGPSCRKSKGKKRAKTKPF